MNMKKIIYFLFLLSLLVFSKKVFCNSVSIIEIKVENLINYKGNLIITLFDNDSKEYYPIESDKAFKTFIFKLEPSKTNFTLKEIPVGKYAISLHHDENGDSELNTNWIGIPNEGLGASNNAKGFFGPPSYEDSEFELTNETKKLIIEIKYL